MLKISIITACYNASEYIYAAYNSISEQSGVDWEWLVVDDASNDASYDVLRSLAQKDDRLKLWRNKTNLGAARSRSRALNEASGDFIAFLDADDIWEPNKLLRQTEFMEKLGVDFSFTNFRVMGGTTGSVGRIVDSRAPLRVGYRDMLGKSATLGCSTVMLRTTGLSSREMPDIRTAQDYAFWLKLLKSGGYAYRLDQPLTRYRIVGGSLSRNKLRKARRQWQIYRKIEKLPLSASIFYFCMYAWRAVFRR